MTHGNHYCVTVNVAIAVPLTVIITLTYRNVYDFIIVMFALLEKLVSSFNLDTTVLQHCSVYQWCHEYLPTPGSPNDQNSSCLPLLSAGFCIPVLEQTGRIFITRLVHPCVHHVAIMLLIWVTLAPFTKVVALYESILEVAWVGVLAVLILYMVGCILTTALGGNEYLNRVLPNKTQVISI